MASVEKIIEDLIKGASRAGAKVELKEASGREEKLAFNLPAVLVGTGLGGIGGALSGGEDHRLMGALQGALAGGGLSAAAEHPAIQRALQAKLGPALMNNPNVVAPLAIAGGLGLPMGAGALAGRVGAPDKQALSEAATDGAKAACDRFGVKHAFLGAIAPIAGSLLGPMAARGALGKVAPMMAKGLGSGLKGQAFDMAASMGGQMLGSRLGGQQG